MTSTAPLPPRLNGKSNGRIAMPEALQRSLNPIDPGEPPAPSAPAKGMTLRNQLLAAVLPVSLVPLALTGALAWQIIYRNSIQKAETALKDRGINNAQLIGNVLDEEIDVLQSLVVSPSVIDAARNGSARVQADNLLGRPVAQVEQEFANIRLVNPNQRLNDYLKNVAQIAGLKEIFFTSKQGFNVAYSNLTGDFFQADENWWTQARAQGVFIADPRPDESAGVAAGVDLNLAIKDPNSGEFLGVMKGVFDSEEFDQDLILRLNQLGQQLGGGSTKVLQLLGSNDQVFRSLTQEGPATSNDLVGGDAVLQQVKAFRQTFATARPEAGVLVSPIFEVEGRRFELTRIPGTDWVAILSIETSDVTLLANQLSAIFLVVTPVLALVVVGVVLLLARRLSKPLGALSVAAGKVAEGDLEVQAEVEGTQEMQSLAETFNTLVTRVKDLLVGQQKAAAEQLAAQAEIARQQEEAARQQKEAKEFLQNRALELLMEVSSLRQGDLSIRAKVTEDEIGTIADSYNATIGSLRKIVAQVRTAAGQVAGTADVSASSVGDLASEALRQADAIQQALVRIDEMNRSIQQVAQNAQQAEQAVQQANQTVVQGDEAMNRTVEGILTIRETVAETAKKVKQLGESSQKISKVVNLIGTFAAQTNLLALNASIEAARAGEEGRGFAVVADEVRSLARQSAQATAEIEQLVASIQAETNDVVTAMESGTQQVVAGTQLVEETRLSLTRIAQSSQQLSELVQSIAQAAAVQSQASGVVAETITDVAAVATTTSSRANQVLEGFQQLVAVAQELQTTVGQFKLS